MRIVSCLVGGRWNLLLPIRSFPCQHHDTGQSYPTPYRDSSACAGASHIRTRSLATLTLTRGPDDGD